uniref:Uncharacterized protein n=1 Tax=Clytia hemisphaerica TaxID=252671 RepID=A0A7M5WS54_9CNID
MNTTTNPLTCVGLNISEGNKTFCYTETWKPFSKEITLGVVLPPCIIAFLIVAGGFLCSGILYKLEDIRDKYLQQYDSVNDSFFRKRSEKSKWFFLVFVLDTWRYVYAVVDLCFDLVIVYKLQQGLYFHEAIYQNDAIIWFLYCIDWFGFFSKMQGFSFILKKKPPPQNKGFIDWKLFFTLSQFFLDEGPELILQFFYIENYEVRYKAKYILHDMILYKDFVYIIVCVSKCIYHFSKTLTVMKDRTQSLRDVVDKLLYLSIWLFTIASILRVIAHFVQHLNNELTRFCYKEWNGRIYQTPFDLKCMSILDWLLLAFSTIPALCFVIAFFIFVVVRCQECRIESHDADTEPILERSSEARV